MLDGLTYAQSLAFEAQGTIEDAKEQKIPIMEINIEQVDEESAGEFIAFWQYVAYYLARLLNVDPFNQPQVEKSKEISYNLRRQYRG